MLCLIVQNIKYKIVVALDFFTMHMYVVGIFDK